MTGRLHITGQELIEAILSAAKVEYRRTRQWQQRAKYGQQRPPLTVWRFADSQPGLEEVIQEVVQSFKGRVAWTVFKPTRNWVIEPLHTKEFFRSRDFTSDVEAAIAFGKEYPDEVKAAFQDLPELAEHLRQRLSQQKP